MAEPSTHDPTQAVWAASAEMDLVIGPVSMRLPPDPSLSRVLRLAASGIAAMAGFTVDETEDIKIAVSEVLLALIEHGAGERIEVEFTVQHRPGAETSVFDIWARTPIDDADHFDVDHPDLMLCRTVLAGVCAQHRVELVDHRAQIHAEINATINATINHHGARDGAPSEIRTAGPNTTAP